MTARDPTLDTLLDLDGQVLAIDPAGYWVRFVVTQVPASDVKPHGLDYTLTLHAPDGERLAGFDNAHSVKGTRKVAPHDHRHRFKTVKPYEYKNAASLVADFWREVEAVMKTEGVWP